MRYDVASMETTLKDQAARNPLPRGAEWFVGVDRWKVPPRVTLGIKFSFPGRDDVPVPARGRVNGEQMKRWPEIHEAHRARVRPILRSMNIRPGAVELDHGTREGIPVIRYRMHWSFL